MFAKIKEWIKQKENIKKAVMYAIAFVLLWYFFFLPTTVLRPLSIAVVPALVVIAIVLQFIFRKKFVFTVYDALALTVFLLGMLSSIFAASATTAIKYSFSLLVYYFAARFLVEEGKINKKHLIAMVLGFALFFLFTVFFEKFFTNAFNSTFLKLLPDENNDGYAKIIFNQSNRLYGGLAIYTDQTEIYLLIGFICCIFFYSQNTSIIKKIIFVIIAVLFLAGLAYSGRRAALLLTFLVVFGYLLLVSNAIWPVVVFGVAVLTFGLLLLTPSPRDVFLIGDILARMKNYLENGIFFQNRIELVEKAMSYIIQKPLIGYGADNAAFVVSAEDFSSFHNSYIESIFEYGFIGGIIYLACIVGPIIIMFVFFLYHYFKNKFNYHDITKTFLGIIFSIMFAVLSIVESLFQNPGFMFIMFFFALFAFYAIARKMQKLPTLSFNFSKEKKFPFYFKLETFMESYEIKEEQNQIVLFSLNDYPKDSLMKRLLDAAVEEYLKLGYVVNLVIYEEYKDHYDYKDVNFFIVKNDKFFEFSFRKVVQSLMDVDCQKAIIFGNNKRMLFRVKSLFQYYIESAYVFDSNINQYIDDYNLLLKLYIKDNIKMTYKYVCLDNDNYQILKSKNNKKQDLKTLLLEGDDLSIAFRNSVIENTLFN